MAIHGIKPKEPLKKKKKEEDEFLFKDPKEYENWSEEEREAETERMMGKIKKWVGTQSGIGQNG